jgi:hypothetical protein
MKVGGTITDWERRPISIENGEGSRGTTAVGAKDVTISKGDMLIIPAGTPHKWESSDEFTYYVVVRADPKGVAIYCFRGFGRAICIWFTEGSGLPAPMEIEIVATMDDRCRSRGPILDRCRRRNRRPTDNVERT